MMGSGHKPVRKRIRGLKVKGPVDADATLKFVKGEQARAALESGNGKAVAQARREIGGRVFALRPGVKNVAGHKGMTHEELDLFRASVREGRLENPPLGNGFFRLGHSNSHNAPKPRRRLPK